MNRDIKLEFSMGTENDISELVRMRLFYLSQDFGDIEENEKKRITADLPEYFARNLNKTCFAFVAKDGEKIVATALLVVSEKPASPAYKKGKSGEVLNVCTMEEYRGHGLCTSLMNNLVAFGRENGLDKICLSATKMGYPVYRKIGFCELDDHYTEMSIRLT